MKLYIAENLKKLRQSKAITQEQLAESLGVSFQSVSRWETGLSYPDIELIPEIAAYFEVSTDVLMGVEKATLEQNLTKDRKRVRMDEFETIEERLSFLEEMHRKYPHDAETLIYLVYALSYFPERREEMQKKIRRYLCHPKAEKVYIDQMIRLLIAAEKEESLPDLLNNYATEEDMSRSALLKYRACERQEWDKFRKYKQYHLLCNLHGLLAAIYPYDCQTQFINKANCENNTRRALTFINMITGTENMDLVSGDGEPDLWFGNRLAYGFQLAGNYANEGKTEEAIAALSSVVSLFEKFYAMPEGTVLTFRCPEFSELYETFRYGVRNPNDVHDFSENLYRCMRSDEIFCGVDLMYNRIDDEEEFDHHVECAAWDIVPLIDTEKWACFDSIRKDKRFKSFITRMQKYVIPVLDNN